jgi:hypothetical protein
VRTITINFYFYRCRRSWRDTRQSAELFQSLAFWQPSGRFHRQISAIRFTRNLGWSASESKRAETVNTETPVGKSVVALSVQKSRGCRSGTQALLGLSTKFPRPRLDPDAGTFVVKKLHIGSPIVLLHKRAHACDLLWHGNPRREFVLGSITHTPPPDVVCLNLPPKGEAWKDPLNDEWLDDIQRDKHSPNSLNTLPIRTGISRIFA